MVIFSNIDYFVMMLSVMLLYDNESETSVVCFRIIVHQIHVESELLSLYPSVAVEYLYGIVNIYN